MLKTILNFKFSRVERHDDGKWSRMLSYLSNKINQYSNTQMKFNDKGAGKWISYIRSILTHIPYSQLLQEKNTSQRYATILYDLSDKLRTIITPYTSTPKHDLFITSSVSGVTNEYIIPCSSDTPLIDLPLDKPFQYWDCVFPIRIIYNDSLELYSSVYNMEFSYKKNRPSICFIVIDVPALIFKYVEYANYCQINNKNVSTSEFTIKHLFKNIPNDLLNCWLLNILDLSIQNKSVTKDNYIIDQIYGNNNFITDGINTAIQYNQYILSNYSVGDFLIKKWLSNDYLDSGRLIPIKSLYNYIHYLNNKIIFPSFKKYDHIELLTQLPIVSLVIKLNHLKNSPQCQYLNQLLWYKLIRYNISNVASYSPDSYTRQYLKEKILSLIELSSPQKNRLANMYEVDTL